MREDALEWVKEQEDPRERRHSIIMLAAIAAAAGAWLATPLLFDACCKGGQRLCVTTFRACKQVEE